MRVELVNPPSPLLLDGFPAGALLSLANYLVQHGDNVDVVIRDLNDAHDDLLAPFVADIIASPGALLVGISTVTATYQSSLAVARAYKAARPDCRVVLGGHHAAPEARLVLERHGEIDYVVVGEGERALVSLAAHLDEPSVVPGLVYRTSQGIVSNAVATLLSTDELDAIPITFGEQGLVGTPGKFDTVALVTARGCPLPCAFCSVSKTRIRAKSVKRVVQDVAVLVSAGFTRISIEDNFFAHSRARTENLCRALAVERRRGLSFEWDCQTRIESLAHSGIVAALDEAGCRAVYIGVESLVPEQLRVLQKTRHPDSYLATLTEEVIPALLQSRIASFINIQFGLPGAAQLQHDQTVHVLRRLGALALDAARTITVFPQLHVVYPGTLHFMLGVGAGDYPADVFETFTAWEAAQAPILSFLGHHFAHGTGGLPVGILDSESLRTGVFEIDPLAIERIDREMNEIGAIEGIELFRYGAYLVGATDSHSQPL